MKTLPISNIKEIEKLLESDDELPSDYDEIPDIPAYQNENRFDSVEFPWLENTMSLGVCGQNVNISSSCSSLHESITAEQKQDKRTMIMNGLLSIQDILCLKCIANLSTDATLHWFINFLMYKDLQSDYKFLKSCLVADILTENNEELFSHNLDSDLKKYNYDIILRV